MTRYRWPVLNKPVQLKVIGLLLYVCPHDGSRSCGWTGWGAGVLVGVVVGVGVGVGVLVGVGEGVTVDVEVGEAVAVDVGVGGLVGAVVGVIVGDIVTSAGVGLGVLVSAMGVDSWPSLDALTASSVTSPANTIITTIGTITLGSLDMGSSHNSQSSNDN